MRSHELLAYGGIMIYCFDLDGTICSLSQNNNYLEAVPYQDMVDKINQLYNNNIIKIFTARGASSGIDWSEVTKKQLSSWGIKYHELIMNKKPSFDLLIDDKAINADVWKKENIEKKRGIIAGAFDVIHPGYMKMFMEAKQYCDHLTVLLHEDPTINKKNKIKTILSSEERKNILLGIRYIDDVIPYKTEEELYNLLKLKNFHVRILGEDYKNKNITGPELTEKIIFVDRSHGWSTTKYKEKIYENYLENLNEN